MKNISSRVKQNYVMSDRSPKHWYGYFLKKKVVHRYLHHMKYQGGWVTSRARAQNSYTDITQAWLWPHDIWNSHKGQTYETLMIRSLIQQNKHYFANIQLQNTQRNFTHIKQGLSLLGFQTIHSSYLTSIPKYNFNRESELIRSERGFHRGSRLLLHRCCVLNTKKEKM